MKGKPRLAKRIFKYIWRTVAIIALLLLGFHIWFIYHSERAIEDLITWASDGKLKSVIKKIKIDYVTNNIDIKGLVIFNTDSSSQSASYRFSAQDFHLRVRSIGDLIFRKQLLIDSVIFNAPDITVTRRSDRQHQSANKKLLLAEELGDLYKTINQSLAVLNLQRFEIREGTLLIKDAGDAGRALFRLSHISLAIDKLNIDSSSVKNSSRFIFSDRVLLRITNQHILLPDGISSVAFDELLIDSKERLIRIIKPAINILPLPGQRSSFVASASLLNVSGLDFNALYQQQWVKADSVFIKKPDGKLEIYTDERASDIRNKKKTPLDSALRHLPVAITISHIVMQDGDGIMYLHQGGKTTSFRAKNNNLSIVGIAINDSSRNILTVDGFNYTIRNYTGYTPDSIYRFRFDSLQFINNKIVLYHFTAATVKKMRATLVRDYTVPRFEITGMDWFSFMFNDHFKAVSAVLYNPVMHIEKDSFSFNQNTAQNGNKKSIYQTLSVMDSILDLDQLQIINGDFSFKQENNLALQLQELNLIINADELTKAKSLNELVSSVKQLSFDTAIVSNPSMSLHISNSGFNSKEKNLLLSKVSLNAGNGNIRLHLDSVSLIDFSFGNHELDVNGIQWKEAAIHIDARNKNTGNPGMENKTPLLALNNIAGNNTLVTFENEKISGQVFVQTFSANNLYKEPGKPIQTEDLLLIGKQAKAGLQDLKMQCGAFIIRDRQNAVLENILLEKKAGKDTLLINIPSFSFIPFINETIATGVITVDSAKIHQPKIFLSSRKDSREKHSRPVALPPLNIRNFSVDNGSVALYTPDKNNPIEARCKQLSGDIKAIVTQKDGSVRMDSIVIQANEPLFRKQGGFGLTINGNTITRVNNIFYYPLTQDWKAQLEKFTAGNIFYSMLKPGNNHAMLTINNLEAEDLAATNSDMKQPLQWLINHSHANITLGAVRWQSDNTDLALNGLQFNENKKHIHVTSFFVEPRKNRDDFIRDLVYRKDYLQASSGRIDMDGMEMKNGTLQVAYMGIGNGTLHIYSDKLKKAGDETIQPLPVSALTKLPIAVKINRIRLDNMNIGYTELNADTRQTGHVYFTHINGEVLDLSSRPGLVTDSLRVNVRAKFLDTLPAHVMMSESYADPLAGLILQLNLGPGDLHLLNSFLVPLSSVQVRTGYLDTMNMAAVANEYVSHGNMRLYYHDLRANILDSGNMQHRKFGTKLLTIFANTLAIRNNNTDRRFNFNFVRPRLKSTTSYFLKMVVEGAAGSIAPISGVVYRKQYNNEIKKADIPKKE